MPLDVLQPQREVKEATFHPYAELKAANLDLNKKEIREKATRLRSRPLVFWFDLNGACNLECLHCGFRKHGRTSDGEVSERIYQAVLEEIMPTAKVCHLGGSNWGEMTTAKCFGRFVRDCKHFDVGVNLTTNGTRLDDDWFDDLIDVLQVVGFSMEGMNEQFEKMRGFKWRFFLKHVERICEAKRDRGKSFRVEWRFCAHVDNIHQLPDMIRLAKSIGVGRIQVMNLIPYNREQEYKKLFYHRTTANAVFQEARQVARELDFDIEIPPDFSCGDFAEQLVQIDGNGPGAAARNTPVDELATCFMPWQCCSINEMGNVRPDAVYWRSMGNLAHSSFEKIWNGRKFRSLRHRVNSRPDAICVGCRKPKFDSVENVSSMQLQAGLRETVRKMLHSRRRVHVFKPREIDETIL